MTDYIHLTHLLATVSMVGLSWWLLHRGRRMAEKLQELGSAPEKIKDLEMALRREQECSTVLTNELLRVSLRLERLEGIPQGGPYRT